MKESSMKLIVKAAEESDLNVTARPDYSGRSMYGKTTCGVVGEDSDILVAICEAASSVEDSEREDLMEDVRNLRMDNMGRYDIIKY